MAREKKVELFAGLNIKDAMAMIAVFNKGIDKTKDNLVELGNICDTVFSKLRSMGGGVPSLAGAMKQMDVQVKKAAKASFQRYPMGAVDPVTGKKIGGRFAPKALDARKMLGASFEGVSGRPRKIGEIVPKRKDVGAAYGPMLGSAFAPSPAEQQAAIDKRARDKAAKASAKTQKQSQAAAGKASVFGAGGLMERQAGNIRYFSLLVGYATTGIFGAIIAAVSAFFGPAGMLIGVIINLLLSVVITAIKTVASIIQTAASIIYSVVKMVFTTVIGIVYTVLSTAGSVVFKIFSGIAGTISSVGGYIFNAVSNTFGKVADIIIRNLESATVAYLNFEKEAINAWTQLDVVTNATLSHTKKAILDVSTATGRSTDSTAKAMRDLISVGYNVADSQMILKTGAEAATIAGEETSSAVSGLITILKSYNMTAADVGKVSDEMFMAVKKGRMTFGQLSDVLGRVIPQAAIAGVDYNEVLAGISVLTEKTGMSAAMAATSISSFISEMLKPGNQAAQLMEELGVQIYNVGVDGKQTLKPMKDLANQFRGLNAIQQAHILGNIRASRFLSVVTKQYEGFNNTLEAQRSGSKGIRAGLFATVFEQPSKMIDKLLVQFEALKMSFIGGLIPIFTPAMKIIFSGFDEIYNVLTRVGSSGLSKFEEFGNYLSTLITPSLDLVTEQLLKLKNYILGIFFGKEKPIFIELLKTTLEEAGAKTYQIIATLIKAPEILQQSFGAMLEFLNLGANYIKNIFSTTVDLIGKMYGNVNFYTNLRDLIYNIGQYTIGIGMEVIGTIGESLFTTLMEAVSVSAVYASDTIDELIIGTLKRSVPVITTAIEIIKKAAETGKTPDRVAMEMAVDAYDSASKGIIKPMASKLNEQLLKGKKAFTVLRESGERRTKTYGTEIEYTAKKVAESISLGDFVKVYSDNTGKLIESLNGVAIEFRKGISEFTKKVTEIWGKAGQEYETKSENIKVAQMTEQYQKSLAIVQQQETEAMMFGKGEHPPQQPIAEKDVYSAYEPEVATDILIKDIEYANKHKDKNKKDINQLMLKLYDYFKADGEISKDEMLIWRKLIRESDQQKLNKEIYGLSLR